MNIMINTLEFAEAFEGAGFGHEQARALANAFSKANDAAREELVTTAHLDVRMAELKADMSTLKVDIVKAVADNGKDITGRLLSTVAIIAGVSTAISATIGAGMVLLLRSGGL